MVCVILVLTGGQDPAQTVGVLGILCRLLMHFMVLAFTLLAMIFFFLFFLEGAGGRLFISLPALFFFFLFLSGDQLAHTDSTF